MLKVRRTICYPKETIMTMREVLRDSITPENIKNANRVRQALSLENRIRVANIIARALGRPKLSLKDNVLCFGD